MKLRTQLLIINLVSLMLLIGALLIGYRHMFLTLEQTQWLTAFALIAGAASATAHWLMTQPIVRSLNRLIRMAEQLAERRFVTDESESGPEEVRRLARSFRRMSRRLEASFRQLEQSERARRELVANVSHDLRTPLASIQSFVEALQDRVLEDPETRRQYLATIRSETRRLSAMIDDLFELSLLDAGQETLHPVPVHLDQVLIEVLNGHTFLIREKNLDVRVAVADDLPRLPVDPRKIARVIGNLLQNAIRHSPEGGTIELEARRLPGEDEVEIAIRDQGEGIPEEDRERIFERFYRTDPSRNRQSGGAGLGLAIARSLVELHRGRIGVRPRPDGGKGSEFWFRLPLHQPFENERET